MKTRVVSDNTPFVKREITDKKTPRKNISQNIRNSVSSTNRPSSADQSDEVIENRKEIAVLYEKPLDPVENLYSKIGSIWKDLVLPDNDGPSRWEILSSNYQDNSRLKKHQNFLEALESHPNTAIATKPKITVAKVSSLLPPYPASELKRVTLADIAMPGHMIKRNLYCLYCWDAVPAGQHRVECKSCNNIAHDHCIANNSNHSNDLSLSGSSKKHSIKNKPRLQQINPTSSSLTYISSLAVAVAAARERVWHCSECIDDINESNKYYKTKHDTERELYLQAKAIILIQKFCRMIIRRLKFRRILTGVIRLQRLHRKIIAKSKEAIQNTQKIRPIRIRLHTIKCFVHENSITAIDDINQMPINLPDVVNYGSINARTFEAKFSQTAKLQTIIQDSNIPDPQSSKQFESSIESLLSKTSETPDKLNSLSLLNPNTLLSESIPHRLPPIDSIGQASPNYVTLGGPILPCDGETSCLMEIFRQGNQYQPNYAQPSRTLLTYPSGQMMITVVLYALKSTTIVNGASSHTGSSPTLESLESSTKYQLLNRVDIPLKKMTKNEKITIPMLESFGVNTSVLSAETLEQMLTEYSYNEFQPSRSYVLFPGATAQTVVKMFVSQVTNWPQALTVGKFVRNINESLMWMRTGTYQHSLSECQWIDIPTSDEHNKMQLHVRRNHGKQNKSVKSKDSNIAATRFKNATISSTANQKSLITIKHERGQYYANALVTWSVLPFNVTDNMCGMIEVRSQFNVSTTFHKVWCVLQDRMIMFFSSTSDMHPESSIDLRSSTVTPEDGGIIRIKNSFHESYYIKCLTPDETVKWFRIVYCYSLSVQSKPYISIVQNLVSLTKLKQGDYAVFVDSDLFESIVEAGLKGNLNTSIGSPMFSGYNSEMNSPRNYGQRVIKADTLVKTFINATRRASMGFISSEISQL